MSGERNRILFVCTGNICRSPMAEYLFRHRLGPGMAWAAESAGVFASTGTPASAEAHVVLGELGIDVAGHRSQPLTADLVESARLLAVMTLGHKQQVLSQFPQAHERVFLLTEFGTSGEAEEIADPIGQSVNVYRYTRDQVDRAIADVILYIQDRWGLSGAPHTKGNDE